MARDYVKDLKAVKDLSSQIEKMNMDKISDGWEEIADNAKAISKTLQESNNYSEKNQQLATDQAKAMELALKMSGKQNILSKIATNWSYQSDIEDDITDGMIDQIDKQQESVNLSEQLSDKLNTIDSAFGGMGSTIKDFVMNPLSAVVALLTTFTHMQQVIGDTFGAMGMREFQGDLHQAHRDAVGLGFTFEESAAAMNELSGNFGIAFNDSLGMNDAVLSISRATATSTENSAKLMGIFTTLGGLSAEVAHNMLLSAENLAVAKGVAPGAILADLADSAETFALFMSEGPESMIEAAVYAKRLGTNLNQVGKTAEGLLNFQDSLNKEVEASMLLGRDINLQKARELSLSGDLIGLQEELASIVGDEAEWNKMNAFQRQALADALNMDVMTMAKLVSKEKEALTVQGQLARLEAQNPIPEESITAVAELIHKMKELGMTMAEELGPKIVPIVEALFGMIMAIEENIGWIEVLKGAMVAWATKAAIATTASLVQMIATLGAFVGKASLASLGFGTLAALALVGTVKSTIFGAMEEAKSVSTTALAEGGIVTQPTNALVGEAGPEAVVPLDEFTEAIEKSGDPIVDAIRKANHDLREDMADYFSLTGTNPRGIGKYVTAGIFLAHEWGE